MVISVFYARRMNIPVSSRAPLSELGRGFVRALFAFLISGAIIFGIKLGLFTATESALAALLLAAFASLVVYRSLSLRDFREIMLSSARTTAMMGFLFSAAFLFAYILSIERIPTVVAESLIRLSGNNHVALLLLINACLFIVGTFMDGGVAIIILTPVFLPLADKLGMDKIHFGAMMVSNLVLGLMTPPVGATLFVTCSISKATIAEVTPILLKMMLVLVVIQLIITFVPAVTLFLPNLTLR
jgi:tripartite ATP-independent transporter DctM subunit